LRLKLIGQPFQVLAILLESPSKVRQPDRLKAVFHQQLQNQIRISPILFSASGARLRESVPDVPPDIRFPVLPGDLKPLHRSRGFDPHSHLAWQLEIKLPHVVAFVHQSHFHNLSRGGVQHRHCLLTSV
jgi:hypothetical protein